MKVAPKSVSGRVVKTVIERGDEATGDDATGLLSPVATGNAISAPSERPSQFRCAVRVVSDQSIVSRFLSSRSAYSVIRKNHCSRKRCSTTAPQRSQRPFSTCSLASTVLSLGHQLTAARFL